MEQSLRFLKVEWGSLESMKTFKIRREIWLRCFLSSMTSEMRATDKAWADRYQEWSVLLIQKQRVPFKQSNKPKII